MSRKTKEMFSQSTEYVFAQDEKSRVWNYRNTEYQISRRNKWSKQCERNGRRVNVDFSVEACLSAITGNSLSLNLKFGFGPGDVDFIQGLNEGGLGADLIVADGNGRIDLFDIGNINDSKLSWPIDYNYHLPSTTTLKVWFKVVHHYWESGADPNANQTPRDELEHLSDIEIIAGSKTLKCHKALLANHSQVFNAMFKHSCVEKESGVIHIDDFEEDTVADFIAFLYEGGLEDKARYNVQLLGIANKYDVRVLQKACAKHMASDINKETVADMWVAAELCQMPELLKTVQGFLKNNWSSRNEMPGIDDVIKNHPEFVCRLL